MRQRRDGPGVPEERRGRAPGGRGWRRPDASMSLLADLYAGKVLDPGYAEAAARRAAAGTGGAARTGRAGRHGRLARAGVPLVLVLAGMLVAVAGAEARRSEPLAAQQRTRLVAEIRDRTAGTDALQRRLEALREQTQRQRAVALARSAAGQRAREELAVAGDAAAATAVSGPALVVTLDDAPRQDPAPPERRADEGRVYDQDLQVLVNGLWAAGATAIGINGQRLTPTTAIRTAGEAILVDYRPLSAPYTVTALAGPARGPADLRAAFEGSAAERRTRLLEERYGIGFEIGSRSRARLPGAGTLRLRYARASRPEEAS
ncbi:DUF881 domain-containing protein [Actinomadura viridis]|uniref:Uncharacterized protein YlxW (UPF0749 family) n=1 Tax=Actinomadura viridis TaxID=58110 RepID=A0A931GR87_9ACTN|nr:DUF881 domain-containing protein [Actinomadura viridis]MBG6089389.1 uncharacterized protein YlxW (UPF0749 family) [Actinomadura viridis]